MYTPESLQQDRKPMPGGAQTDFSLKLEGTTYALCDQDELVGLYGLRFPRLLNGIIPTPRGCKSFL